MQTLIRKELREIARPFLLLLALLCALWFVVAKFGDVLLRPLQEPLFSVLGVCAFWGAALAFGQFSIERWRGTNAFLVHRGTGRWGAFVAKATVGSLATWCLAIVPPILFALWYWLATPYGPVVQGARVGELLGMSLLAFPCYGAGAVAAALRRARGWGWLLALLGTCGAAIIAMWAATVLMNRGLGWFGAILGIALVAAGLLALAWHLLKLEDDREFALPQRHSIAMAIASLVLVVAPVLTALMVLRVSLAQDLGATPVLVQSESTQEVFVLAPDGDHGWRRLDGKEVVGGAEYLRTWTPWSSTGDLRTLYNPAYGGISAEPRPWPALPARPAQSIVSQSWVPLGNTTVDSDGWQRDSALDLQNGLVRSFRLPPVPGFKRTGLSIQGDVGAGYAYYAPVRDSPPRPDRDVAREFRISKPGGERFSAGTVGLGSDGTATALCDPSDGSLWMFVQGPGEPRLERIELPDGDRFVRLEYLYLRESAKIGGYANDWALGPLIIGEKSRYVVQGFPPPAQVVPYDAWPVSPPPTSTSQGGSVTKVAGQPKPVPAAEVPALAVVRLETLDSDPLRPSFALRDARTDELMCTLNVEPLTQRALWTQRVLLGLSFLRPPWATAWSFCEPAPAAFAGRTSVASGDVFAGGHRAGLAAACVGMALALAAWIVLRGTGARASRWTWAVLVALFGLPVFAMYLLCQPRRAQRRVSRASARESVTSAQPLIQSA